MTANPPVPPSKRLVAAALAFVSVTALVWATFSHRWARDVDPDFERGFGLRDWQQCEDGDCDTRANSWYVEHHPDSLTRGSRAFPVFGWITTVAAWVGAAALALAAALMLAGRFVFRPIAPTSLAVLALAVALVAGCVFTAMNPGRPYYTVSWGFLVFGAGEVGGILAAIWVARIRPREPEWDDPQPVDEDNW